MSGERKVRALRACKVLDSRDVIRGQYDGYADDSSITNKKTTTERSWTRKLLIYASSWMRVPRRRRRRVTPAGRLFILTAGKALQEKKVEVRIVFREAPCQVPELEAPVGTNL